MDRLEIIQRKALRIVLNKPWFCSKKEIYSREVFPVSVISHVNSCIFAFKLTNGSIRNNVNIGTFANAHQRVTRNRNDFIIRHSNTKLSASNLYIRGLSLYNNLPRDIKNLTSINNFKRQLKEHLYATLVLPQYLM
ncbi:hypothetical protein PVAND_014602 [Polypedilum vanderplanki]|uniref:Uncharacterized protein n=1 Tax=Polypedilum vanderplanki TaxID=319348 RepID=A0A9J6BAH2_POLVA|nr:hypothetical protein PVAND_014602 [Polypedilum vanderplanki]